MDKIVRREIIMDNYQFPMHKGLIDDDTFIKNHTKSTSCIDNVTVMMKIVDGQVVDAYFDGEACAICTSATSILLRTLIGKSIIDAKRIIENFQNMINESSYDEALIGELNVYEELYLQPNRKNCALLPSNNIKDILNGVK
jgi:nitrogen fixation NifU-like protein